MGRPRRVLVAAVVLALCAQPAAGAPRPPHERPADLTGDEAGIWYISDKAEQDARRSGDLDSDAALTAYVKGVECKVAPEYCDEVRVYVMDRPVFNAMTAPNGYIEVWTGALLRARDEAELAFILGHETTHYALDHSLQARRQLKQRLGVVMPIGLLAAPFAGALVLELGYLGAIVGFQHFSREQESEADRGGFDRLTAAGYDPAAAATIWRSLIDEHAQSSFDKVRLGHAGSGIFDDHPLEGARLDALSALAKDRPPSDRGKERYRAAIRPHLAALLRDDLRRRDFGETLYLISRLQADGGDEGVLGYYRGECLRQRRADGDLAKAVEAYQGASATADAPVEVWRELGDLYAQQQKNAQARAAYQTYLDRAPAAQDRWMVEGALKKLGPTEAT
jgi:beta-barrel assembly-enhancing protease